MTDAEKKVIRLVQEVAHAQGVKSQSDQMIEGQPEVTMGYIGISNSGSQILDLMSGFGEQLKAEAQGRDVVLALPMSEEAIDQFDEHTNNRWPVFIADEDGKGLKLSESVQSVPAALMAATLLVVCQDEYKPAGTMEAVADLTKNEFAKKIMDAPTAGDSPNVH